MIEKKANGKPLAISGKFYESGKLETEDGMWEGKFLRPMPAKSGQLGCQRED
jgi:hypothetical protein